MANKLLGKTARGIERRAAFDMALRNDAILDREVFTSIMHAAAPSHPLSVLGRLFGDVAGIDESDASQYPNFSIEKTGLASSYINVKEEYEKASPLRVTDNSKVPAVILANTPFEITVDRNILDDDENFHLKDQKTFGRVYSRRGNASSELTVVINGQNGDTFSGSLFNVGSPLIYGMGNTQGEASKKSNSVPMDTWQYNTFFNPMVINRYFYTETGSYLSDEMYAVQQQAMDGSTSWVNTGLTQKAVHQIMKAMGNQILYSVGNYDPVTKQILGRSTNSRYTERPNYAGLYQQMDQAPLKFLHDLNSSSASGLQKIERIMQVIAEKPGDNKVMFAMAESVGYNWLIRQIKEGGLERYGVQLQRQIKDDDEVTVGFKIRKFVTEWGTLYIWNVGKGMQHGETEYDTFGYDGSVGTARARDIFFFPGTSTNGGRVTKVAKLFVKEGQIPGHGKVSRGLVVGDMLGITGENNTRSADMALDMDRMVNGLIKGSSLSSLVDANEKHFLWENCPYIDVRNMVKLSLI